MIVVMENTATEGDIADVVERLSAAGCRVQRLDAERVTLGATGGAARAADIAAMPAVASALPGSAVAPLVARLNGANGGASNGGDGRFADAPGSAAGRAFEIDGHDVEALGRGFETDGRGFDIAGRRIGDGSIFVMAGPCSVESPALMDEVARAVAAVGGQALRAGAYKPRTSPHAFQGEGEEGLLLLRRAADAHGLLVISEVLDAAQIPVAARYCDILQVGARNMYNTPLLRELGRSRLPVLLKRGLSATLDEWLSAAEYVASVGNPRVILCERGIRTFETATRNTLDLSAVPLLRRRTRLPVVVDPSHGTGLRDCVRPMALAAVAAGADGLLVEAHPRPEEALSDAAQTVSIEELARIVQGARSVATALGAARLTPS